MKVTQAQQWVRMGRVQSFMVILGRVELGHFIYGSGWVGSRKLDLRVQYGTSVCSLILISSTAVYSYLYCVQKATAKYRSL